MPVAQARWLSTVLYSSRELLQWLCHDDSAMNIVMVIVIIIVVTTQCSFVSVLFLHFKAISLQTLSAIVILPVSNSYAVLDTQHC